MTSRSGGHQHTCSFTVQVFKPKHASYSCICCTFTSISSLLPCPCSCLLPLAQEDNKEDLMQKRAAEEAVRRWVGLPRLLGPSAA
jgi:hypothetical protein